MTKHRSRLQTSLSLSPETRERLQAQREETGLPWSRLVDRAVELAPWPGEAEEDGEEEDEATRR